jgi:hypothetical protein
MLNDPGIVMVETDVWYWVRNNVLYTVTEIGEQVELVGGEIVEVVQGVLDVGGDIVELGVDLLVDEVHGVVLDLELGTVTTVELSHGVLRERGGCVHGSIGVKLGESWLNH